MVTAPETVPEAAAVADGRVLAVVAVLGLNAWASVAALPAWHLVGDGSLAVPAAVLAAIAPVPLVLGLLLLRRQDQRSHLSLVLAFPVALLLPALVQPSMVRGGVLSAPAVAFASLGLAAYLLAACWARGRVEARLVASRAAPTSKARPRYRSKVYHVALPLSAALAVAVIIGAAHLSLPDTAVGVVSDGTREVVASAFALALWVVTMLVVFVPAAKRPRLGLLPRASRGAAVVWLLVLVIAAVMVLASSE